MIDKSTWPEGEWKYEPDEKLWVNKETGYLCYIKRVECTGALCGYVGVNSCHPLFKVDYLDNFYNDIDIHGGITFTGIIDLEVSSKENLWWIGFDCSHWGDIMPNLLPNIHSCTYKNIEYVRLEVESLARKLKHIEIKNDKKG